MSSISSGAFGSGGGGGVGTVKFLQGNDSVQVGPSASGIIFTVGTHGINTTGNAGTNTETWALNNTITLGDLSSIIGSPAITLTTGDLTLTAGNVNLPSTNTAGTEGVITFGGVAAIAFPNVAFGTTPVILIGNGAGNYNLNNSSRTIAIGQSAGNSLTGTQNTIVSQSGFQSVTSGSNNTGLGFGVGGNLTSSSSNNILIGNLSGNSISGALSGNIFIGYGPTTNTNNRIHIGFTNSGSPTQTTCFIDGIAGASITGSPVGVTASGQLGVIPASGGGDPAFFAVSSSLQTPPPGTTTINFNAVVLNVGSAYNSGTSIFTAPSTGIYQINVGVSAIGSQAVSQSDAIVVFVSGSAIAETPVVADVAGDILPYSLCMVYQLAVNDQVSIAYVNGGATNAQIYPATVVASSTFFSISRL